MMRKRIDTDEGTDFMAIPSTKKFELTIDGKAVR